MSVPKPPGCDKNIDGDQLAALKNISPDDMKALINSHAGSEGCKNEIRNSLDTAVSRGQTMDMWLRDSATVSGSVGWSGGSASAGVSLDTGLSTTDTNLSTESTTMSGISSGCRQTLMNMNESNSLYSQMTCNIKVTSNTVASDIRMGATISVRVGPTEGQVAAYDRKVAGINDNIARLLNRNDMNEFTIKSLAILNDALEKADAGFRFDIKNSSFKITNSNVQKLISTNNQEIENNTKIREAILKKATSEAITGVTQKFEMGAQASQDLEAYATSKINDTSLSTTQDIVQAANDTKLSVDMNGNITLNINGSLEGTNVVIDQGNITEMRSELIMKAASDLGKDVATEIIHEALTKGSMDTEGTGLASYQKAIADGLAEQAKNLKPGGGGLFGGLFGGIFGKIAMIAIPIIIILVLFSMFGFKIALVAGLIFGIYLAIAYFVGLTPFSKENNEIDSELYDAFIRSLIAPRRKVMFDDLRERIRDEKTRIQSIENNGAARYVEQLDSAMSWIDGSSGIPFLLKMASWTNPGPPPWVSAAMFELERDTYTLLINMLQDIKDNNGDGIYGDPGRDGSAVIPILKRDRDELTQILNGIPLTSFDSSLKLRSFASATAYANGNPIPVWSFVFSRYQAWIDNGKPSGPTSNRIIAEDAAEANVESVPYVASAQAARERAAFSDNSSSIPTGPALVDFRGYIGPDDTSLGSQIIREIIVPRKTALYENLYNKIKKELDGVATQMDSSPDYVDKLNDGMTFLYELINEKKYFLLSSVQPTMKPPDWVALTVIKLEMSIYNTLLPLGKTLSSVYPELRGEDARRIKDVLYRGDRELKILMEFFVQVSISAKFVNQDEKNFSIKMADQVLRDTPGPDSWNIVIRNANEMIAMYGGGTPQGYASETVMETQAQPVTYAMAVPQQPPQKGYTKSGKKSHAYGKVAKKSPMYDSNQNSRGMATMGGEILNTVQKEYSRRNPKTVKPVYHKTPDFRPK
jgi:hypothetical protein